MPDHSVLLVDILPESPIVEPMKRTLPAPDRLELFQGTLDLLILRTLCWGSMHGHGIAKSIEMTSGDAFRIDHGSLYPALQRLLQEGWISGTWGVSTNNRRAKFYRLTSQGRKKLAVEQGRWERFTTAIVGVLQPGRLATEEK